ncbi:MAG: phage head morphogenesis protein [Desulfuromusa sp.]|nr:phage head morphogenesis protein [Desulfuromusa sp.]
MATVTAKIKQLLAQKDQQILTGTAAVRSVLAQLRKQVLDELQMTVGDSYTVYHLKQNKAMLERALAEFKTTAEREVTNQLNLVWQSGGELLVDAAYAGEVYLGMQILPQTTLETLADFAFSRIDSLSNAAWNKVRAELTLGVLGQKTPHQVTQAIAGSLDGPGVFKSLELRAETIVKTEMGRTYSTATMEGIKQAAKSVPELQKEWWHAGHPKKPRINHLRLHGQRQPVDKPFLLGGLIIDYPRSPGAPIQEVIGCGCEVVPWHPDWDKESQKLDFFKRQEISDSDVKDLDRGFSRLPKNAFQYGE